MAVTLSEEHREEITTKAMGAFTTLATLQRKNPTKTYRIYPQILENGKVTKIGSGVNAFVSNNTKFSAERFAQHIVESLEGELYNPNNYEKIKNEEIIRECAGLKSISPYETPFLSINCDGNCR